jgi:hypothetical protein
MTSPSLPTLIGSRPFAKFKLTRVENWNPITVPMESGHVEVRARWDKPPIRWMLSGNPLDERDVDLVMGFLRDRKGGGNFFYINDFSMIWSPRDAPTTATTTAESIAGRTVYVSQTFGDGTNETEDSDEATQVIAGNDVIQVTVAKFPSGVTEAKIYMGVASGTLSFAGTESSTGGTWTEPFSTVDADSASGQKVLNVADTTDFEAGQTVVIDEDNTGGGTENIVIDTVQAGVSITSTTNLANAHTAIQADEVYLKYGTGTSPPSSNSLKNVEYKVRLVGNPQPVMIGAKVWRLNLLLEEMF